jgi:hypothetical protein
MVETLMEQTRRKLRKAGHARFPVIAEETGVPLGTLRKIAYGERDNPRVGAVQSLLDFFEEVESGRRAMPDPRPVS